MPWTERKLTQKGVGIELTGLRLGPDLSPADRKAVYDATVRHGVTVLPGQDLSDDDIFEFAASLEDQVVEVENFEGVPDARVTPLGNIDLYGNRVPVDDWVLQQNRANELWHIDTTFMTPRASISMLYGRIVPPEGGNTEFCDTRLLMWRPCPDSERDSAATRIELLALDHPFAPEIRLRRMAAGRARAIAAGAAADGPAAAGDWPDRAHPCLAYPGDRRAEPGGDAGTRRRSHRARDHR